MMIHRPCLIALALVACSSDESTAPTDAGAPRDSDRMTSEGSAPQRPRFTVSMDDTDVLGPMPSWANARRDYGAKGDGLTDDAPALQHAINDLGLPNKPAILYLPAGTYRIASTLNWTAALQGTEVLGWGVEGLSIIGESPETTKIVWAGPAGGTMLLQNGGINTRYARITWDGQKKAGIGIAHFWDDTVGIVYDGSSEDTDEVFQDMRIGIMAGRLGAKYGNLNSEGQVRRVTFLRNTFAGLDTGSFNALDWWVMDSHFVDCARGVSNNYSIDDKGDTNGAGGFYVYRSLFERSTVADVDIGNTGWFSVHDSVSVGSRRFFNSLWAGRNAAILVLQHNRVIDTTDPAAISLGTMGPLIMIDNQFKSADGVTTPFVSVSAIHFGRDVVSVGNSFTVPSLIGFDAPDLLDRVVQIDDKTVAGFTISQTLPKLPSTRSFAQHKVFEVPAGKQTVKAPWVTGSAEIQSAVDLAVASGEPNAVVHLPPGYYALAKTVVVPPKARIQIVGDGLTTNLTWGGAGQGPFFSLQGPSYATIRDLAMGANPTTPIAIEVSNADQVGGRVFIQGSSNGRLRATGLSQTQILGLGNPGLSQLDATDVASLALVGNGGIGPATVKNSYALYADTWFEGVESAIFRVSDSTFSYIGGQIAPASHKPAVTPIVPAIQFDGFRGSATFLGFSMDLGGVPSGVGIDIGAETADTHLMFLGCGGNTPNYFLRRSSGGDVGLLWAKVPDVSKMVASAANAGDSSEDFVRKMLAQMRSLTWDDTPYTPPSGATDVHFYRMTTADTAGITISR